MYLAAAGAAQALRLANGSIRASATAREPRAAAGALKLAYYDRDHGCKARPSLQLRDNLSNVRLIDSDVSVDHQVSHGDLR